MIANCLMVTEDRAPIVGVSYASLRWQEQIVGVSRWWAEERLHVGVPAHQADAYEAAAKDMGQYVILRPRRPSVSETLHALANAAFEPRQEGRVDLENICLVWDDDDIAPRDRLEQTLLAIQAFHPRPVIASYTRGWFVNARTLHGYLVDLSDRTDVAGNRRLWGGTLAWNHAAWLASEGFWAAECPGYDREFLCSAHGNGVALVEIPAEDERLPIALCHTKNVATHFAPPDGAPEAMETKLQDWLPAKVFAEVKRFQKFCVDNRIFPPWSDR